MYYFYNRGVDSILTTKGWIPMEEITKGTYSMLACENDVSARDIFGKLNKKYGKTTAQYTIYLKEEKLVSARPALISIPAKAANVIKHGFSPMIQFLIQNHTVRVSSAKIFTKTQDTVSVSKDVPVNKVEKVEKVEIEKESKVALEHETLRLYDTLPADKNEFIDDLYQVSEKMTELYKDSRQILLHYERVLAEIEAQIEDLLHCVEFESLSIYESIKFVDNLQELRRKRRMVKDSLYIANLFSKDSILQSEKIFHELKLRIESLSHRSYVLRAPEQFEK